MKILIIGYGSIARKHVTAARELFASLEIEALRSSRSAEEHPGIRNIYAIGEAVHPDFVIVSNPTNLHADAIREACALGVPLMIEKPVLDSLAEAAEVRDIINSRKLITYIACNLRFHPALVFLKEAVKGKRVNEVSVYCGSYLPDWRPGRDFRTIYSANAEMGGGVHLDLIHELDYCCWLFGMPQRSTSTLRSASSLDITAIDYAHYLLEYPGFCASITLNYFRHQTKRTLEIVFEDATWTLDLPSCLVTDNNGQTIFSAPFSIQDTYREQLRYFTDAIKNDVQPMNSLEEGLDILKICVNEVKR
jgi:predicted dehydrogenase